jgi:hypothetical protein
MKLRRGGQVVEELGLHVEPVQLQVVCFRLWEKHREAGQIDAGLVRGEAGDVDAALSDFYAEQIGRVCTEENIPERRLHDWCELRLVTPQGLRGQVQGGDEAGQGLPTRTIDALIDARILRAEERRGLTWYELAHDRLIEPVRASNAAWREQRLQPWQRRAALYLQVRREDLLLDGKELDEARHWAEDHTEEVTEEEKDYLRQSARKHQDRVKERRLWWLIQGLVLATLLIATGLTLWALKRSSDAREAKRSADEQRKLADEQRKEAEVAKSQAFQERNKAQRALASQSLSQGLYLGEQHQVPQGLQWLARGLREAQSIRETDPDLESLIKTELVSWQLEQNKLRAFLRHDGEVFAVALSADGRTALTGSRDQMVRLWDVASGRAKGPPLKHDGEVVAVALSADGRIRIRLSLRSPS